MSKIVHIADFYYPSVLGGGELNNDELISLLQEKGFDVVVLKSGETSVDTLENLKERHFIISNFIMLSAECKEYLQNNCSYVIYEHDHKYLKNRNPAIYSNYVAPESEIINKEFYKKAKQVLCQSLLHKSIMEKNLKINNITSLSGNLWSVHTLRILRLLAKTPKTEKISILDSPIEHKNTNSAVSYCILKNLSYEKIKSNDYHSFLEALSKNEKLLFIPKTPETLSRVVVEAKMMGVKVITNKNVGASHEDWFSLSGGELIDVMEQRRDQIVNLVVKELHE